MTLINLYGVTNTLLNLLALNVSVLVNQERNEMVPIPRPDLTVTAMAPERVENPNNTLSLFLYHVAEDAYYKNALGPGSDIPNVARTPMALCLYYILTTHHEVDPQFDAQTQQNLMGYALKTFHDFPVITDQTEIGGMPVLENGLQGRENTIQVILRPVSAEDAIAFWSSEDTRTARLSAYYEVRVIMLEPEPPRTLPGVVLSLGTFLVQLGSPHLETTQSLIHFQLPARNGGTVQPLEATPAQVTLNNPLSPTATQNQLQLRGTNLAVGQSRSLVLQYRLWDSLLPLLADGTREPVVLDLSQNPAWQAEFASDRITLTLEAVLVHRRPDNTLVNLPILPGIYGLNLRAILNEQVIQGELKQVRATSNEVNFAIAPRIETVSAPNPDGTIDIHLDPDLNLVDGLLPADSVQMVVAGQVYSRVPVDPPPEPRQFFVRRDLPHVPPLNFIRINPHFPVVVPEAIAHPFRLIVNGAESVPVWIELTP
ncbi:Pvc16 family protein [Lyngbya confervoides]|uniref:DUF4255 domain-containing protein n=1 Tax=Lyngbya confervoides BDU141951 TaxID=1574623 RepID=A0ABD4T4B0_9CYAN|nr:Pvc16 family protein [Lyngbya confervoides]MCM1983261.1 DUF4255 domain-containing protein [Lyngbya confervoides BDU141951]